MDRAKDTPALREFRRIDAPRRPPYREGMVLPGFARKGMTVMGIVETVMGPRSKRDKGLPYTYEAWIDILGGRRRSPDACRATSSSRSTRSRPTRPTTTRRIRDSRRASIWRSIAESIVAPRCTASRSSRAAAHHRHRCNLAGKTFIGDGIKGPSGCGAAIRSAGVCTKHRV